MKSDITWKWNELKMLFNFWRNFSSFQEMKMVCRREIVSTVYNPSSKKKDQNSFLLYALHYYLLYCLRSHSYVWFQGWTPKAFTPGGKRANLHFHENNLRGNLWNFQAIHKVCASSSTLKIPVASSEENKDYCKMQIRSNLS